MGPWVALGLVTEAGTTGFRARDDKVGDGGIGCEHTCKQSHLDKKWLDRKLKH